ncbi:MAG: hypothetical protein KatS3mg038_1654 [Candidatus Kapaibacterium sp.]|nr:MAG: hypothetical protein KatS3mg038_1654 [Candidatus Kapabacteria bacterium]
MSQRCPICGGADACPAGRYTPGAFRPVLDDEIIRADAPIDGCALTHRVAGRYWCIPLVDAQRLAAGPHGHVRRQALCRPLQRPADMGRPVPVRPLRIAWADDIPRRLSRLR